VKSAKDANLPVSLVEKRNKRSSVYCLREYFEFILIVESVFLVNLSLKMMLAYNHGDIVAKIESSIVAHEDTMEIFVRLTESSKEDVNDNKFLLAYIVERYKYVRDLFCTTS